VTGTAPGPDGSPPDPAGGTVARPVNAARLDLRSGDGEPPARDGNLPWRTVATAAERLSSRDFADLSETELRLLEDLMRRRVIATPPRRSRRQRTARPAAAPTCGPPCGRPGVRTASRSRSRTGPGGCGRGGWSC